MDEELFHLLQSSGPVRDLVGAQIYWGVAPQSAAFPYLVLNIISGGEGMTLSGPDGLWQGTVQIDCYATKRPAAKALSDAVKDLLHGYGDGGFQGVFLERTREENEEAAHGRPSRMSHDFNINWSADHG